ncbi:VCBS domain-containing protein, partial [Mesorhizobium sp. LNJC380A00]|uniref:VCBS domain-containing protein n=1 Tax=Mesorhizobium sp. LNJC380A00 TaxID=1287264 RepID=UPI0004CE8094
MQALDVGQTLTETFNYTMKDADGDTALASLTITINGTNDVPQIVVDQGNPAGAHDLVYEAGLAAGSAAGNGSTVATGTFTVSDPDGLDDVQSVTIGGTTVAIGSLNGSTFPGDHGTLLITGYNARRPRRRPERHHRQHHGCHRQPQRFDLPGRPRHAADHRLQRRNRRSDLPVHADQSDHGRSRRHRDRDLLAHRLGRHLVLGSGG